MNLKEFFEKTFEWLTAEYKRGALDDIIQKLKGVIKLTKEEAEQWWHWAKLLALVCTVVSLGLFLVAAIIGGFIHTGWPNALAGLLIAPILFILLLWWTPLVAIIAVIGEIIHLRFKGIQSAAVAWAKWWLGVTCGILLWQVIASLAFTFIPYWNAPSRIPVMMLLALAMTLIGIHWGSFPSYRKIIRTLVILAFVAQVAVCFVPQLATLATASTSRLDKNVQAAANKVEREGFFPAKPPTIPPPRDVGWMVVSLNTNQQSLFRAYEGDTIYYYADKGFWVEYEGGNKYFNNPSYNGKRMKFTITSAKTEGESIKAWGDEPLQLKFRVESRL